MPATPSDRTCQELHIGPEGHTSIMMLNAIWEHSACELRQRPFCQLAQTQTIRGHFRYSDEGV